MLRPVWPSQRRSLRSSGTSLPLEGVGLVCRVALPVGAVLHSDEGRRGIFLVVVVHRLLAFVDVLVGLSRL